jgi:branched-chain amino acid transport system substrate-binding protein
VNRFCTVIGAAILTCVVILSAGISWAADGVSSDTILFGQAAVLQGPAAVLGQGMRLGIQAAFDEINNKGGVHGRRLKLLSLDYGYDPDRSIAQTKKLIEEEKVFGLIGAVGTPTATATVPIARASNVPFIGPFTGAEFLRNPNLENVINVRASYDADSFGRAGLAGVKKALDRRGVELVAEGTFERNTVAVKAALVAIKRAEPEAVVMVGTYKPCAEFIKLARKGGFNPIFVNISFVGASALARELGPDGKGVIVSQVVPFPWDTSLGAVADYQAAIKALDPTAEPDFVSLEGYLAGRLAIAALEKVGPAPSRQAMLKAIKDIGRFDIGGLIMTFGPNKNEGLDQVFLTAIQSDGSFKAVRKLYR